MKLQEGYSLAKCCKPQTQDSISGYYSHNMIMIVHRAGCANLDKVETSRVLELIWDDILNKEEFTPGEDYQQLEELDFHVLKHHQKMGVDYSHVVARALNISKQEAFDCHKKLKSMKLLERVKKLMIRYRKGVVDNKWIKHRNHTYYELTTKGKNYLEFYQNQEKR